MDIEHWIENTGERRVRKPTSVVRRRAGGEGLCKQYLACCLSYYLIGIIGSHADAERISQEVKRYIEETLRLTIAEEKFHIRHGREGATFLGYGVKTYSGNRVVKVETREVSHDQQVSVGTNTTPYSTG